MPRQGSCHYTYGVSVMTVAGTLKQRETRAFGAATRCQEVQHAVAVLGNGGLQFGGKLNKPGPKLPAPSCPQRYSSTHMYTCAGTHSGIPRQVLDHSPVHPCRCPIMHMRALAHMYPCIYLPMQAPYHAYVYPFRHTPLHMYIGGCPWATRPCVQLCSGVNLEPCLPVCLSKIVCRRNSNKYICTDP